MVGVVVYLIVSDGQVVAIVVWIKPWETNHGAKGRRGKQKSHYRHSLSTGPMVTNTAVPTRHSI